MSYLVETVNPLGWLKVFRRLPGHSHMSMVYPVRTIAQATEFATFDEAMRACNRVMDPVGIEMTVVEVPSAHARDEDPADGNGCQVTGRMTRE